MFAAWTAGQAQTVGYPDMASVVAHVLACRPTEDDAQSPAHRLETLVRMAKVLALIDPAAARDMLAVVAPHSNLLGTGYSGFEQQDWLVARCLAEPERTAGLCGRSDRRACLAEAQGGLLPKRPDAIGECTNRAARAALTIVMGLNSGLALRARRTGDDQHPFEHWCCSDRRSSRPRLPGHSTTPPCTMAAACLTFRAVELVDRPVRPLAAGDRPTAKACYGLLAIGSSPEHYAALVWLPERGEVWIDGDGDGRFALAERHRLAAKPLEIPVVLRVGKPGAEPARLKRTVVLRRAADGGLRYAMRGYVAGTLHLDGLDYAACSPTAMRMAAFDSAAHDRVWLDLDRDGRFDPLTEQFPLGKPLDRRRARRFWSSRSRTAVPFTSVHAPPRQGSYVCRLTGAGRTLCHRPSSSTWSATGASW